MPRVGFLCPEMSGHLHPMMSLARAVQRRGHDVTFYQRPISIDRVAAAGFRCRPYGSREFPVAAMNAELAKLAGLGGRAALAQTVRMFARQAAALLRDLPDLLLADGIDLLVVDQAMGAGSSVAEIAGRRRPGGLPFVVACNALDLDQEPDVPPFCFDWPYRPNWLGRLRNQLGYRGLTALAKPVFRATNAARTKHGLRPINSFTELAGRARAVICQQPAEFDFPRKASRPNFHFVGPMVDAGVRPPADFPYDRLDGRPVVYASMGTLQNGVRRTYETIAASCHGLGAQLVIALGGGDPAALGRLPGDPVVARFAPQLDLIRRSTMVVTHAGLNTALECLSAGVPMVAIPVTNDQPGVAARIAHVGAGEVIPIRSLDRDRLRAAVKKVLAEPAYRAAAGRMRDAIARCRGAEHGADLVEEAMRR